MKTRSFWNQLNDAGNALRAGKIVAIPTETVYGLAARIDCRKALKQVFQTKRRPFFDPLIVHVDSFVQANALVESFPPLAFHLATQFWPGPLTIVLKKSGAVDPLITAGLDTVAIRMPAHPFARRLIRSAGAPLAAPSANRFGKTSPTTAAHVQSEFGAEVFVVDGGSCRVGLESTVLTVKSGGAADEVIVYRPGGISEEQIRESCLQWTKPVVVRHDSNVASPGHLKQHYQPELPLVIIDDELSASCTQIIHEKLHLKDPAKPIELALHDDPTLAARELYAKMREASANTSQRQFLFVRRTQNRQGAQWRAIWDRLERAASLDLGSNHQSS